jgi:hypothetical protein
VPHCILSTTNSIAAPRAASIDANREWSNDPALSEVLTD